MKKQEIHFSIWDVNIIIDTLRGSLMIADNGHVFDYKDSVRITLMEKILRATQQISVPLSIEKQSDDAA